VLSLGVMMMILLGFGLWLLSVSAPERVDDFKGRLKEDSRSAQYSQLFEQVPLHGFVTGLGPKATYSYKGRTGYEYIDNQFLFILFKFGLPVLAGYCAVVIWPGLRLLFRPRNQRQRLVGIIFAFWGLASLGLSIFHSITLNPQNFLIILLAGASLAWAPSAASSSSATPGRMTRHRAGTGPSNGIRRPGSPLAAGQTVRRGRWPGAGAVPRRAAGTPPGFLRRNTP